MNAATHRTERTAEQAPTILRPVPVPSEHVDRLARLEAARTIQSKLVDYRQMRLDEALDALHALDAEIDRLEAEVGL